MKNTPDQIQETAQQKLDNLEKLQVTASDIDKSVNVAVDEDGYYIIGNKMFVNYMAALRYIVSLSN
jgi:phosphatidate phosphatase APP1